MEKTQSGYPDELNQNNEASISESRSGSGKSTGRRSAGTKKRRKSVRTDAGRFLIAKLLALVCLVLVVFEGNVIYRLFSHQVGTSVEIMNSGNDAQTEGLLQDSADPDVAVSTKEASSTSGGNASVVALAGGGSDDVLPESPSTDSTPAVQSSEYIESSKVVPQRDPAVDDSYFNNAVFIGDSRMEGFRNSSGITQGTAGVGHPVVVEDTIIQFDIDIVSRMILSGIGLAANQHRAAQGRRSISDGIFLEFATVENRFFIPLDKDGSTLAERIRGIVARKRAVVERHRIVAQRSRLVGKPDGAAIAVCSRCQIISIKSAIFEGCAGLANLDSPSRTLIVGR